MFTGELPEAVGNLHQLNHLSIGRNHLCGEIPTKLWNCSHLQLLELSSNNFTGELPEAVGNLQQLISFHIYRNQFSGRIPESLFQISGLEEVVLGNNNFSSSIPLNIGNATNLVTLDLSSNNLSGELPVEMTELRQLESIDLSNNQFSGLIPEALGINSTSLKEVDLSNNNFSGEIPPNLCFGHQLYLLDLNRNRFLGKIPRIHSPSLTYLDLGNNQLNDTFPFFLGEILSNSLEILILRSNKLYGSLEPPRTHLNLIQLKVLDISSNYFTGDFPLKFILGLDAIKHIHPVQYNNEHIDYPETSSVVIYKGKETRLNRQFMDEFRAIDMSNNALEGMIPRSIGELVWLKMLNLSNNNLSGSIPSSLGNLTRLESLDLSYNRLSGEIPRHLTDVDSLAVLNLSYNNLTGPIPDGVHFSTFLNDSFRGNSGLCGLQISRKCGSDDSNKKNRRDPIKESNDESNNPWSFGWEPVVIGYGCGILIGLVIQYFVFTKAFLYRWFG